MWRQGRGGRGEERCVGRGRCEERCVFHLSRGLPFLVLSHDTVLAVLEWQLSGYLAADGGPRGGIHILLNL